jgi:hypothetical protein
MLKHSTKIGKKTDETQNKNGQQNALLAKQDPDP